MIILGDPVEVTIVKEIFQLYLGGSSFKTIAELLKERGVPAPNRKRRYTASVRAVLTNPVYRDDLVACRCSEGKFHTVSRSVGARRRD